MIVIFKICISKIAGIPYKFETFIRRAHVVCPIIDKMSIVNP